MRTWARTSTPAALLAVAVMSFTGSGAAFADTSGDGAVGGGNQVDLPISLPIDISGNAVGVVGSAEASSQGGAEVVNDRPGGIPNRTSGNGSVAGGNQVNAPISIPVNACGNAIAVVGRSDAGCRGGATVRNQGRGGAGGNRTSGDGGVLAGNQVTAPISAPLNACGNAVAIFGNATAGCRGGTHVLNGGTGAGGNDTSGNGSVLGGNQAVAPVAAPVNICGNAIAVFGRAFAGCRGGSSVTNDGGPGAAYQTRHMAAGSSGNDTDGRFGAGSGNQVVAPVSLPVDVCGNAAGNASANCTGGATVHGPHGAGGNRTSGEGGVLSGNQAVAPVTAPVNVCGNAAALVGHAFAGCKGGATVKKAGRGAGGNHTSGRGGVLSGNQVVAPITAPVNVCGNAAAVLGDAAAGCLGGAHAGRPGHAPAGRFAARTNEKLAAAKGGPGSIPALGGLQGAPALGALQGAPAVGALQGAPALGALQGVTGATQGAPAVGTQLQDLTQATPLAGLSGVTGQVQDVTGQTQFGGVAGPVRDVTAGTPLDGLTEQAQGAGSALPLVQDAARTVGLPVLPDLPGLPSQAQTPAKPAQQPAKPAKPAKSGKHAKPAKTDRRAMSGRPDRTGRGARGAASPLNAATELVASTPVGGTVNSVTRGLPVGDIGLMSAAQPAGVTGMNSGSLLALMLGAMFAASATLFASARRFRFGRK